MKDLLTSTLTPGRLISLRNLINWKFCTFVTTKGHNKNISYTDYMYTWREYLFRTVIYWLYFDLLHVDVHVHVDSVSISGYRQEWVFYSFLASLIANLVLQVKISRIGLKVPPTFLTKNFSLFLNMRHMQMSLLTIRIFRSIFYQKKLTTVHVKERKQKEKLRKNIIRFHFFIKVLDVKIIRISSEKLDGVAMNSYLRSM